MTLHYDVISDNVQLCTVCTVCMYYCMNRQYTQVGEYVLCICTIYVCVYVIDLYDNGKTHITIIHNIITIRTIIM